MQVSAVNTDDFTDKKHSLQKYNTLNYLNFIIAAIKGAINELFEDTKMLSLLEKAKITSSDITQVIKETIDEVLTEIQSDIAIVSATNESKVNPGQVSKSIEKALNDVINEHHLAGRVIGSEVEPDGIKIAIKESIKGVIRETEVVKIYDELNLANAKAGGGQLRYRPAGFEVEL